MVHIRTRMAGRHLSDVITQYSTMYILSHITVTQYLIKQIRHGTIFSIVTTLYSREQHGIHSMHAKIR